MSEMKNYTGGCHCGAVRYEFTADITQTMTCNCSICWKTGATMAFLPASQFTLKSGEGALTDYQFGKKSIHHRFCKTCGIRSFGDGKGEGGKDYVMVNLRCVDDFDGSSLPTQQYDGKST